MSLNDRLNELIAAIAADVNAAGASPEIIATIDAIKATLIENVTTLETLALASAGALRFDIDQAGIITDEQAATVRLTLNAASPNDVERIIESMGMPPGAEWQDEDLAQVYRDARAAASAP